MLNFLQTAKLLSVAALALATFPTVADTNWPQQTIRLIVPYPAGGGTDFTARLVASELSKIAGQDFIVENKTGAAGTIGAQTVARAAPDGYTLLVASPAEVLVGQIAGQQTNYDPQKDLTPVTLLGETPLVVTVHPSVQANDMGELIALAKKKPLSYGTPGVGSTMHFSGESLNLTANTEIMHVAYRGAAPAITDLLGNQIPLAIVGMPPVVAHHQAGRLRIIAVTSDKRSSALPEVPSVSEMEGFENYRFTNWFGIFAPAGTDPDISQKMSNMVAQVMKMPEIKEQLQQNGIEPVGNSPEQYAQFLEDEKARYESVQEHAKITIGN
ncbi:MAG: tripartite tricarboxylate transporter substrate binding protein [Pusillimonas sp.]